MEGHVFSQADGIILPSHLNHGVQARSWADLPPELLFLIADRLGLVELLGFRGVCKDWLYASSTASARSESAEEIEPSFLVCGDNKKCDFYYQGSQKTHSINIPELVNAICLASDGGWLLLAQGEQQVSLFFFCPFSRTRIELPQFPQSELSGYVASFSASPTSPDCILAVANQCNNSKVELHLVHRGASTWTKHESTCPQVGTLTGAFYDETERCFYFVDNEKRVLKFSTKEQNWKSYTIVARNAPGVLETLPFASCREHKFRDIKSRMGLQDDISISICGTYLRMGKHRLLIKNGKMEPPSPEGSARVSQLKGIWIHPRFHQIPPNQGW